MADTRNVPTVEFPSALRDLLSQYYSSHAQTIDNATRKAAAKLVEITKSTAPRGAASTRDSARPRFHTSITYRKLEASLFGVPRFLWMVKSPNYRLTHLLAKAHRTRNGRIVPANPFLQNALDAVAADYEQSIRRILAE